MSVFFNNTKIKNFVVDGTEMDLVNIDDNKVFERFEAQDVINAIDLGKKSNTTDIEAALPKTMTYDITISHEPSNGKLKFVRSNAGAENPSSITIYAYTRPLFTSTYYYRRYIIDSYEINDTTVTLYLSDTNTSSIKASSESTVTSSSTTVSYKYTL